MTLAVMSEPEPDSKTHPLAKITAQLDTLANAVAKLEGLSSAVAQTQALSKQSLLLSAAAVTSGAYRAVSRQSSGPTRAPEAPRSAPGG